MAGWIDPKTQRATAFYSLLGVLCSNIYHTGLNKYNFMALVLMAGVGSLSGLAALFNPKTPQAEPPGGTDGRT
jgi:hypothetical protein